MIHCLDDSIHPIITMLVGVPNCSNVNCCPMQVVLCEKHAASDPAPGYKPPPQPQAIEAAQAIPMLDVPRGPMSDLLAGRSTDQTDAFNASTSREPVLSGESGPVASTATPETNLGDHSVAGLPEAAFAAGQGT